MLNVKKMLTSSVISWSHYLLCKCQKIQKIGKLDGNSEYWKINSSYLLNNLKNINILLKITKNSILLPLRRYIFWETTGGVQMTPPPPPSAVPGLSKSVKSILIWTMLMWIIDTISR